MTFWKFQVDFVKCKKASFLHVFLQKIYEYTHEFKKLIRAHQVLIISYQTPRKIMESDENCEIRGIVEFFFQKWCQISGNSLSPLCWRTVNLIDTLGTKYSTVFGVYIAQFITPRVIDNEHLNDNCKLVHTTNSNVLLLGGNMAQ